MVMIMKATDQRIRAEILARYDVDARRCREVFFPAGQQLHAQDAPLEKEGRAYRIANTRQLLRLASLTG